MSNFKIRLLARTFILLVLIGLIITMSRCSNQKQVKQQAVLYEIAIPETHQPSPPEIQEQYNVVPDAKIVQPQIIEVSDEEELMLDLDVEVREFNTEEYDLIVENDFKTAWDNPLSTFSIDVDKASFANIRRFLSYNEMPPKDAVRLEEMINYFKYDYPQPSDNHPFALITDIGQSPWNPQNKIVQIGIQGKSLNYEDLKQGNYVFLIDVSGSMDAANKLPLVKKSLNIMLDNLQPEDRIALVVYAGAAGLVLPSTPVSQKEEIKKAINNLNAGGSTAGGEGIQLAYSVAMKNIIPDGNNRIILATDGDFNVGVSSTSELVRMVEEKRKEGIYLTICGYGLGNYKDDRLEQISSVGNGVYFYIDNVREAERVFAKELRANLFTIAKDVKIQVEFNPMKVKSYRLVGYENRMLAKEDFEDDQKDAGELGAGHSVTALYEIVPADDETAQASTLRYQSSNTTPIAKSNEWLTLKLRYKPIGKDESILIEKQLEEERITPTSAMKLAQTVAGFGMLLRESKFKGDLTYEKLLVDLKNLNDIDEQDKWELVKMIETAALLSHKNDIL